MARISTLKAYADNLVPCLDTNLYNIKAVAAIASAAANSGDYITLYAVPRNGRIVATKLTVDATLGASCTAKVVLTRAGVDVQDLTAATTAGAASTVSGSAIANVDAQAGDLVELKIGGANVGAAANAITDVHIQH